MSVSNAAKESWAWVKHWRSRADKAEKKNLIRGVFLNHARNIKSPAVKNWFQRFLHVAEGEAE